MKKTKLILTREQIKLLTPDALPHIVAGMIPDSNRCLTHVSSKEEVYCNASKDCPVFQP